MEYYRARLVLLVFGYIEKGGTVPIKKYLLALTAATCVMAAQQEQPTPYDLIRPTWPLTWDESAFNRFDTTVTKKKNMVPKNRTPASYKANELIPDTLNQAYLDNINTHMSPIRINQAGYLEKDGHNDELVPDDKTYAYIDYQIDVISFRQWVNRANIVII